MIRVLYYGFDRNIRQGEIEIVGTSTLDEARRLGKESWDYFGIDWREDINWGEEIGESFIKEVKKYGKQPIICFIKGSVGEREYLESLLKRRRNWIIDPQKNSRTQDRIATLITKVNIYEDTKKRVSTKIAAGVKC